METVDLATLLGPDGPLAQHMPDYELRPSQLQMAAAVREALLRNQIALIEAPTGTGKSIAYLLPALLSGKTVVIATANKSLQNQLFTQDVPFLGQVLGRPIDAVLVKGRSNYVCTHKWEKESFEQKRIALYDREHEQVKLIGRWLSETDTGDVDELSFELESDLRPRLVSFPDDCLHRDCAFHEDSCWVNLMRDRAAAAQVLITNHHLLLNALELGTAGERILPPAGVYVVDEAHQLEATATAVFEVTVTDYTVEQLLSRGVFKDQLDEDELDALRIQNIAAFQEVSFSNRQNSFRLIDDLEDMKKLGHALEALWQRMQRDNPFRPAEADAGADPPPAQEGEPSEERGSYERAVEALGATAQKVLAVASAKRDGDVVRFVTRIFDRRHATLEIHAAPINPATRLAAVLFEPIPGPDGAPQPRTVICTSATLATNGTFDHFKRRCGVARAGVELIAAPVFDYPRQALLYQPALPAYDWRNKDAYYAGVSDEILRLLEVSRGRALCLFTNWSGLQQVRDRLMHPREGTIWPLLAQGDASRNSLLEWFRATPHSVLLATKSFWEGVDLPGDDLSLVVLDKMPFPSPSDPLHSARMEAIDAEAGEESQHKSFAAYMVPLMTLALKQGFGRLIRRATDRGVVAILDDRLSSKAYGRRVRLDLPPAKFSRSMPEVHHFFRTALDSCADFALNVRAVAADDAAPPTIAWHWQLVRLQDGKSDRGTGSSQGSDPVGGEMDALVAGLQNLHRRIADAKRDAGQFSVEVRCRMETAQILHKPERPYPQFDSFQAERSHWRSLDLIGLTPGILEDLPAAPESDEPADL